VKQSDEVKARNAEVAAAYKAAQSAFRKVNFARDQHTRADTAHRAAQDKLDVAEVAYETAKAALDKLTERTTGTEATPADE